MTEVRAVVVFVLIAAVWVLDIAVLMGGMYSMIQKSEFKELEKEKLQLEIYNLEFDTEKKHHVDMRTEMRSAGKADGKFYCPYCGRMRELNK